MKTGANNDNGNSTPGGGDGDSISTGAGASASAGHSDAPTGARSLSTGTAERIRARIARLRDSQKNRGGASGNSESGNGSGESDKGLADPGAGTGNGVIGGDSGTGVGHDFTGTDSTSPSPAGEERPAPVPAREAVAGSSAPPEPSAPPRRLLEELGIDPNTVPKKRGRKPGSTNSAKPALVSQETDPRKVLEWIELGCNGALFATRHEHWQLQQSEKEFLAERVAKCIDTLPEEMKNSVVKKALDLTPWFGLATGYLTIIHPRLMLTLAMNKAAKNERRIPHPESEPPERQARNNAGAADSTFRVSTPVPSVGSGNLDGKTH